MGKSPPVENPHPKPSHFWQARLRAADGLRLQLPRAGAAAQRLGETFPKFPKSHGETSDVSSICRFGLYIYTYGNMIYNYIWILSTNWMLIKYDLMGFLDIFGKLQSIQLSWRTWGHGASPSHHPFIDGTFHCRPSSWVEVPPCMEPPQFFWATDMGNSWVIFGFMT